MATSADTMSVFHQFLPSDPRLRTQIGIREPHLIRAADHPEGALIYGPYIHLQPGTYDALVRFDPAVICAGSAEMDVVSISAAEVFGRKMITSDEIISNNMTSSILFSSSDPISNLEVRLICRGEFSGAVQSVEISGARVRRYSDEFENEIASYATNDKNLRTEKVMHELYIKLGHANDFFDTMEQFVNLARKRFIDAGCGTGYISVAAASRGAIVSSTDFVEKCVELTAKRFAEHGLISNVFQSDLRSPVPDERKAVYDFVMCNQVLEHIPRDGQFQALANLFSMVAPAGFLFIDTENSLCPFDRHDTRTWLLRYTSKEFHVPIIHALGNGLNLFERSYEEFVQIHDYLSYDEIIGAALVSGFRVVNRFMPHLTKQQMLRRLTGSDWLHDSILRNFDVQRFAPVSILLQRI